jgi:hypothetical protein
LLTGCAAPPPPPTIQSTFDPREAEFARQPGNGVITGQAFLRQQGGGVVTCAGSEVTLAPVTTYSQERANIIYGNAIRGFRPASQDAIFPLRLPEPPSDFMESLRLSTCDAQGKFRFDAIPPGQYFLATRVIWRVGSVPNGGALMRRITVTPGQSQDIILSQ